MKMDKDELRMALCEIDNGRFDDIIHVLKFTDSCSSCGYFNLAAKDRYRCRCAPLCIAATLHPDLISYINWKRGWIDENEYLANMAINP